MPSLARPESAVGREVGKQRVLTLFTMASRIPQDIMDPVSGLTAMELLFLEALEEAPLPEQTGGMVEAVLSIPHRRMAAAEVKVHLLPQGKTERSPARAVAVETAAGAAAEVVLLQDRTSWYLQAAVEPEALAVQEAAELPGWLFYITRNQRKTPPANWWTKTT